MIENLEDRIIEKNIIKYPEDQWDVEELFDFDYESYKKRKKEENESLENFLYNNSKENEN